YLIRRTRSFIKDNYAELDLEKNRKYLTFSDGTRFYFPDRLPKKVDFDFDPDNPKDQYAKLYSQNIVDIINGLDLPRYGLGNYILQNPTITPTKDEEVIIANLSRAGKRLMGFCRTNLFKRLESSGFSFLISLSRHILRNYVFFYAIQNNLPVPIGKNISQNLDDFLEDADTDGNGVNENTISFILDEKTYLNNASKVYDLYASPKYKHQFDWIRSEFFAPVLLKQLAGDSADITKILKIGQDWNAGEDRKLNALHELLSKKHKDEKILVFTQYADTAYYISEHLKSRKVNYLQHVTGDSKNPTALAQRFSPVSNKLPATKNDIRVLITTDVLSEGQ
ncbi:MAG: helicase, partial [Bacteroidales bacterium]|nr:helicase [Bacteroidales bacterium]